MPQRGRSRAEAEAEGGRANGKCSGSGVASDVIGRNCVVGGKDTNQVKKLYSPSSSCFAGFSRPKPTARKVRRSRCLPHPHGTLTLLKGYLGPNYAAAV